MPKQRPTAEEWEIGLLGKQQPEAGHRRPTNPTGSPGGREGPPLIKLVIGAIVLITVLWGYANMDQISTAASSVTSFAQDFINNNGTQPAQSRKPIPVPTGTQKTLTNSLDGMKNAEWLRATHPDTYDKIRDLAWTKNGLDHEENKTAQDLINMGANDHETLNRVLSLQWIRDDVTPPEAKAIRNLMYLSYRDSETSRQVAVMPFLESVAEKDALLVAGLHGRWYRGTLAGFMRHPTVADGISEEETVRAVAATTIDEDVHLGMILTPGNATVETIQTSSPMTTHLSISIVRAGERRATNTSLIIEEAVGYVENAMGMALPTDHVILLLDDTGVSENFAGTNYGQAIAYLREGEDGDEWERAAFTKGIAHEVAHYFWHGNENWIDEGMADTIDQNYGTDKGLPPQMMVTERKDCTVTTLQALSEMAPEQQNSQFLCNYYLGGELFLDLQNALGREEFSNRARRLYEITKPLHEENEKAGLEEIQQVFGDLAHVVEKHWTGKAPAAIPTTDPDPGATESELQLAHQLAAERAKTTFEPRDSGLVPHNSPEKGFTIKLPGYWNATLGAEKTQFRGADTRTDLMVIEHREMDRTDFINQYETEVIDSAGGPPRYYEMAWETNPNGAHYYEIHSGRQASPTHCAQEGYTRVYESQSSAGGPVTTIIGYKLCVESPLEQFQEMTEILDSFTVIRPWPERGADIPLNVIQVATSTPYPTPTPIPRPVPTSVR